MNDFEQLLESLNKVRPYPESFTEVKCEIKGIGFFPGARGLYANEDHQLSNKKVMVLGHDFGAERDYISSINRGEENLKALTWKNLNEMLLEYEIQKEDCFFTNCIMGVRNTGSAIGASQAFNDKEYIARCNAFLIKQISLVKPEVILVLGKHVWDFISDISHDLRKVNGLKTFAKLDEQGLSAIPNVHIKGINDFQTHVVFITHPTYRHLNVKTRKFKGLSGKEAEKLMIKN